MNNRCCPSNDDKCTKNLVIMGPTGPRGATGPTGPTARCNKSSIYIFKW